MGVKTTNNIRKRLNILIKKTSNLKVPMRIVAQEMKGDIRLNFEKERSYEGEKWKKSARAKKDGGKTLRNKSRLYDSFTIYSNREVARVGTKVKYARLLNYGAKQGEIWKGEVTVKAHYRRIKYRKKNGEWAKNKRRILIKSHRRKAMAPWGDIKGYKFMGISKRMIKKATKILEEYILRK